VEVASTAKPIARGGIRIVRRSKGPTWLTVCKSEA
jgi:hypothetical protein